MQKTAIRSRFSESEVWTAFSLKKAFPPRYEASRLMVQTLRIMRMLTILILGVCLHVSARTSSQTITLTGKNLSLEKIFTAIKQQSGYTVFSNRDLLKSATPVAVSARNMPLPEFLELVLRDQPLGYRIDNHTIFLSEKPVVTPATFFDHPLSLVMAVPIRGRVLSPDGKPQAGISVALKKGANAVVSDADGFFSISVNEGDVLVFTGIGFEKQEAPVTRSLLNQAQASGFVFNVTLELSFSGLDSIAFVGRISTGYQTVTKEKMTGAAVTISGRELSSRYNANIADNLEGRAAGLVNYGGKIMIRGVSSIRAETSPLLVVDGLPIEGSIEDLNPFDVENISILKDAAATAIYGARASNGIIVVTTKQAGKWIPGRRNTIVDVASNTTVYQKKNINYEDNFYMSPAQQVEKEMGYADYYFFNSNGRVPNPIGSTTSAIQNGNYLSPVMYAYYQRAKGDISQHDLEAQMESLKKNNFAKEFADHILRNRVLQQYNVAVRSSGEKFQSNLVLNYKGDNSGLINTKYNMFNVYYKGNYEVAKWLSADFNVNTIIDDSRASNKERISNDAPTDPFNVPSYYRLLNDDGSYADYTTNSYNIYNTQPEDISALQSVKFNHLKEMFYDQTKTSRQNIRYNVNLNFRILKGLTANTQFIYESERYNESSYSEAESFTMRMMKNSYTIQEGSPGNYTYRYMLPENGGKLKTKVMQGRYWTSRGQINYSRNFDKHAVDVIAGMEFRQTRNWGNRNLLFGYDDQLQTQSTTTISFTDLYAFRRTTFFKPSYAARDYLYTPLIERAIGLEQEQFHRYGSGYANATYVYDDKYNLFASFRKDYADVFGLEAKFRGQPLWSVGAGWNAHNEDFMKQIDWVNFLKLRLAYGVTGNIYQGATSYMTANTTQINSVTKQPWSEIRTPANPVLRWEQTATINLGVDFALLENRLTGAIDWYRKKTTDLFAMRMIESTKGFTSMIMNAASLLNNGIELSLSYDWFKPGANNFRWNTMMTFAHNKNRITEIEELSKTPLELAGGGYKIGYPVNSLYSFEFAGLDQQGWPTWYKANGNPDRRPGAEDMSAMLYSGQKDPVTNLGLTNYIAYKGFSINLFLIYYGGHHLRAQQAFAMTEGLPYRPLQSYWLNSWTPDNPNTNVTGFGQYAIGSVPNEIQYADIYVRPAAFIKLRNVVLGYDLPRIMISKLGMKTLALRLQINNPKPLWVKNDIGIDPETGGLRLPTSFVFGINMNF